MMTRRQVPAVQDVQKPAEVPQALFMDRAMDITVVQQRQMPMAQMMRTNVEMQQVHSLDKVVDVPVVMQRQVATIWPIQKTVEVPQIQYITRFVDAPVAVAQHSVPLEAEALSQARSPQRVDDVSVAMQQQGCRRLPREGSPFSRATRWWTKHPMMMRAARLLPRAQSPVKLVVSSKGCECRRELDETGKRDTTKGGEDPGVDLLPVVPNVEVGGSHLQATSERDDERILEWSRVCLACHPIEGASSRRHSFASRDSRQAQAASSGTPQKAPSR